jgi:hypothetical protein
MGLLEKKRPVMFAGEIHLITIIWTDATTHSGAFASAATPGVPCPGWPTARLASRSRCGGRDP